MRPNKLRELLKANKPTLSTHIHTTWPSVVEAIGHTGLYDYVEFVGDGGAGVVTVRQFQRAIGHIASCAGAPKDIAAGTRLHAAGEEGEWRFIASEAGARLELAGRKAVRFPASSFEPRPGKTNVFDAWSAQDGGSVRIDQSQPDGGEQWQFLGFIPVKATRRKVSRKETPSAYRYVAVWDWQLRFLHWAAFLAILTLCLTGWLIDHISRMDRAIGRFVKEKEKVSAR